MECRKTRKCKTQLQNNGVLQNTQGCAENSDEWTHKNPSDQRLDKDGYFIKPFLDIHKHELYYGKPCLNMPYLQTFIELYIEAFLALL